MEQYCLGATVDDASNDLGGGWTLVGFGERASDGGHGDRFWYRANNWADAQSSTTPAMTSLDAASYPDGDAKSMLWNTMPATEVLFRCVDQSAQHWWFANARFALPERSSLAEFFASERAVSGMGDREEVELTLNHPAARLYADETHFMGGVHRDIDGMCDHWVFARDDPTAEVAQSSAGLFGGEQATVGFGDDGQLWIRRTTTGDLAVSTTVRTPRVVVDGVDVAERIRMLEEQVRQLQRAY